MNKIFADFISHPGKAGLKDHYENLELFDSAEIQVINQYFSELNIEAAATRSEQGIVSIAKDYRSSRVGWVPKREEYRWLYQRLGDFVNDANQALWQFDLSGMAEPIQLTEYHADEQGHYDWHTDVGAGKTSQRKISLTIQLSDDSAYEGGELQFMSRRIAQTAVKKAGAGYAFPSYLLHRVKPITAGVRRSIVVWVSGPPYR